MVKLVSDDADRKESLRARLRPIADLFVQAIRERRETPISIRALMDIMAKSGKYDVDVNNKTSGMVP